MDKMSPRPLGVRRLWTLILLLLGVGLMGPAGAAAAVSNVKVSNDFVSENASSFQAAPSQDHTYVFFTPNADLGPGDTIHLKGPPGMEFPDGSNYGIGVGGLSGSGYSVAGHQVTNGGRDVSLTMNEIFSATVGERVQVQISDALLPRTAGSYTLTASTSEETTDITSASFSIFAGALDELTPSGGDGQSATVGTAFADPLEVTAEDRYDNPIGGLDVTFTTPDSGASGTFGEEEDASVVATTNSAGVASSDALTANTVAGAWTATATAGSEETTTFSLTNAPGNAAALSVSGGGQTATAGSAFADPVSVAVTDSYGNGVPGVSVLFSNPCGGSCGKFEGSGSSVSATTDASGTADSGPITAGPFAWTSPSSPYENWSVFITAGTSLSDHATLTNVPGPLDHFVFGTGYQEVGVGEPFEPIKVRTVDAWGNPLAGVKVNFVAPADGPSTSTTFDEQTTDGEGKASSGAFLANAKAGFWTLEISAGSGGVSSSSTLRNLAGDPASAAVSLDPARLPADGQSRSTATVTVADHYGNPLPGETVALSANGPGTPPVIGAVSDESDGTYTAPITASKTAGKFTIEATVDDYPAAHGSATLKQLDVVAPLARISKQPKRMVKTKRKRARVKFRFRADEPATFQCKLDRKRWKGCASPMKLKLRKGRHTLRVRAVDSAGNRGPVARAKVRVVRKEQKRKRQGRGHGKGGHGKRGHR